MDCATKYKSIIEWQRNNYNSYAAAWRHGWLDKIMDELKIPRLKGRVYTISELVVIASRYKKSSEWQKSDIASYTFAQRIDALDLVKQKVWPPETYTFDEIYTDAQKYQKRMDWIVNGKTYKFAKCNKKVDEIYELMGWEKNTRNTKWWYGIQRVGLG